MANVSVYQKPISIEIECDNCEEEITIPYNEFVSEHGEPCDWTGQEIKCHECGYINIIDSWDF